MIQRSNVEVYSLSNIFNDHKILKLIAINRETQWSYVMYKGFKNRLERTITYFKNILNVLHIHTQYNNIVIATSASLTALKPLTVWMTTNWKILQEMGIPAHLTCLLRNLYAGQDATVRTGCGTMD